MTSYLSSSCNCQISYLLFGNNLFIFKGIIFNSNSIFAISSGDFFSKLLDLISTNGGAPNANCFVLVPRSLTFSYFVNFGIDIRSSGGTSYSANISVLSSKVLSSVTAKHDSNSSDLFSLFFVLLSLINDFILISSSSVSSISSGSSLLSISSISSTSSVSVVSLISSISSNSSSASSTSESFAFFFLSVSLISSSE